MFPRRAVEMFYTIPLGGTICGFSQESGFSLVLQKKANRNYYAAVTDPIVAMHTNVDISQGDFPHVSLKVNIASNATTSNQTSVSASCLKFVVSTIEIYLFRICGLNNEVQLVRIVPVQSI